jgi:hypothetical protein
MTKEEAILSAIRVANIGDDVILHNKDYQVWCVFTIKSKEHNENSDGCIAHIKFNNKNEA